MLAHAEHAQPRKQTNETKEQPPKLDAGSVAADNIPASQNYRHRGRRVLVSRITLKYWGGGLNGGMSPASFTGDDPLIGIEERSRWLPGQF